MQPTSHEPGTQNSELGTLNYMLRRFLRASTTDPDSHDIEQDIRKQVRELEQEATAFHEAIGLLRAALSLSSEGEMFWRDKINVVERDEATPSTMEQEFTSLLETGWRRERLHNHTLRNLYHQMLEAKRRFLYHWHATLQQQLTQLPPDRQPPLRALLNNTLQGLLSMGIEQIEANHRQELEQILQHQLPVTSSASLDAVTSIEEDIDTK